MLQVYRRKVADYRIAEFIARIDSKKQPHKEYAMGINLIGSVRAAMGLENRLLERGGNIWSFFTRCRCRSRKNQAYLRMGEIERLNCV